MDRSRATPLTFCLISLLALGYGFWTYHAYYTDDAYISLRYARNFIDGSGLVWNPGERVEGYSNFLFVLIVSALGRLGLDLVVASKLVGVAAFVALLLFLVWWGRSSKNPDGITFSLILPAVLTASSFCTIIWAVGGLETVLCALFVTIGVLFAQQGLSGDVRSAVAGGVALGLATLTRPDSGLFLVVASVFYAGCAVRRRDNAFCGLLGLVIPFAILVGTHEIWRYLYYGDMLPNTWYAKGVFAWERARLGCLYLFSFCLTQPAILPALIVGMIVRASMRNWDERLTFVGTSVVAYVAYVISGGGDHMTAFRPLVVAVPLMTVMLAWGTETLVSRWTALAEIAFAAVLAVLIGLQIVLPGRGLDESDRPDGAAFLGRIVGEYINQRWQPGCLVALNSAGATPYYAPNLRFIDMLGLNDRTIAKRNAPIVLPYQLVPGHAKGDGSYVLARRPDYIIAGPSMGCEIHQAWTLSEYEMCREPEFSAHYALRTVRLSVANSPGYKRYLPAQSGEVVFTYYQRVR